MDARRSRCYRHRHVGVPRLHTVVGVVTGVVTAIAVAAAAVIAVPVAAVLAIVWAWNNTAAAIDRALDDDNEPWF